MLKKLIDGKEIICSPEEEALIRKKWALNETHPEYSGHLMFDGISEPTHDMKEAIKSHRSFIQSEIEMKIKILQNLILRAEELGADEDRKLLISRRKYIRELLDYREDDLKTITDLSKHLKEIKSILPHTSSPIHSIKDAIGV